MFPKVGWTVRKSPEKPQASSAPPDVDKLIGRPRQVRLMAPIRPPMTMPAATTARSVLSTGQSAWPTFATNASTWRVLPPTARMSPRRTSVSGRIGSSTMLRVMDLR